MNSKLFWKTSKQLLKLDKKSQSIPTLVFNNEYAEDDLRKANMLNNYFALQSSVNDNNSLLPQSIYVQHEQLENIHISVQDVRDVLDHLDPSKASGPDMISPRLLKEGSPVLARPLSLLFNRSLFQERFPSTWKDSNVTPIHKKNDKSVPSNFRPVSLLSQIGKSMERCVHKHFYNYLVQYQQLTPLQSGFIRGDSTTYQLLHTYHTICEAVDRGKEVRVVFCDISKAFDRVWHRGLLHKLKGIGCSEHLLQWFKSYLSDRRQRVVLNGETSDWASISAGVPQGSILGPVLFLIYINDIVKEINSSIRLFADDTSLYVIVDNPQSAAYTLNNDLEKITQWSRLWLVDFNPAKTISMIVTRKSVRAGHPDLIMNNTVITESSSHTHLGLTFSQTGTWDEHIRTITDKAWTRLNLLRSLKFRINRKSLEKVYISFIRPLIEYSDSVWDNVSSESKKALEAVHNEAARIITGATKLCSIEKMLADLGWESLQTRRRKHKLVTFYKIINGLAPAYLRDTVPPLVQDTAPYRLRNADHIQNFHANTNLFYNSFFPSTIRDWNSLSDEVKQAPSLASFKFRLNRDIQKPPAYYNAGTRLGQILQARIRMECSSLNSHLYRKNIVPSPSCTCGGFESPYHFFFVCPMYMGIRNRCLPQDLQNYNTRDLLFGKENANSNENEQLFAQVQDFILNSRRFA